jgi:hypothetical protein
MAARRERDAGKGGDRGNQFVPKSPDVTLPKLADMGITKSESSRWQRLAEMRHLICPKPKWPPSQRVTAFANPKTGLGWRKVARHYIPLLQARA